MNTHLVSSILRAKFLPTLHNTTGLRPGPYSRIPRVNYNPSHVCPDYHRRDKSPWLPVYAFDLYIMGEREQGGEKSLKFNHFPYLRSFGCLDKIRRFPARLCRPYLGLLLRIPFQCTDSYARGQVPSDLRGNGYQTIYSGIEPHLAFQSNCLL